MWVIERFTGRLRMFAVFAAVTQTPMPLARVVFFSHLAQLISLPAAPNSLELHPSQSLQQL
jgi:hypothetical protein